MPTITIGNGDRNDRLGSFVRLQRPNRATQQTESFLAQKGGRKREERVALAPNSGVGLEEELRPRWPLDRGGNPWSSGPPAAVIIINSFSWKL